MLPHAPGVQMSNIPEDSLTQDDKAEADKDNPDERMSSKFNFLCHVPQLSSPRLSGVACKTIRQEKCIGM